MTDFWDSAKGVLGTVAPILATAVGGPLAGVATRAICGAIGLDATTPQADVAAAVGNATANQLLALRRADGEFAAQMKQMDIDVGQLGNDDRASARDREVSVRDWTPRALAISVTVGFFGLLVLLAFRDVPAANQAVLNIMIGALGTGWVTVLAYYYGSSAGSAVKTDALANSVPVSALHAPALNAGDRS